MARKLFSRRTRYFLYKVWALLGLVRWYNIVLMAIALYLSAIYLFNPESGVVQVLRDIRLHLEILALILFIASGFIINAFYDLEKDIINRPTQTFFQKHISKEFSFGCYFAFNSLAALISLIVDWKVFGINVLFSFVLWAYSHKMRKMRFIGEMGAAMLTIAPFFSLSVYYWDLTWKMFAFISLIFLFILTREVVKKLIAIRGDIILGDQSIPIVIGERAASIVVVSLGIISMLQVGYLVTQVFTGISDFLFYAMLLLLSAAVIAEGFKNDHLQVNFIYKILILLSILTIPYIGDL
jgi:4-hydroxybenzoate polyprenyltransferase